MNYESGITYTLWNGLTNNGYGKYSLFIGSYSAWGKNMYIGMSASASDIVLSSNTTSTTIKPTSTATIKTNITIYNGNTLTNVLFKPIIYKGTYDSTKDFEPYTGEIAVPNPDNPQDIYVVKNNQNILIKSKNLLNLTNDTYSDSGIVANVNNGTITLNGTATANSFINIPISLTLNGNQNYIMSANNQETIGGTASQSYGCIRLRTSSSDDTSTDVLFNVANNTKVINKTSDTTYAYFRIRTSSGLTYNNFVINPQIEVGNTASSYVVYKKDNYKINLSSKNLFDKNNVKKVKGAISGNGFTYSYYGHNVCLYIDCQAKTTYTVQKRNDGDTNRFGIGSCVSIDTSQENAITSLTSASTNNNENKLTITTGTNDKYLIVLYYRDVETTLTEQQLLDSIQIEVGSTATDYVPYFEPIELCKIGTNQDYIYKNNGNWYLHKAIGKTILNGSETWKGGSTGSESSDYTYFYSNVLDSRIKLGQYVGFCNNMKVLNGAMLVSTVVSTDTMSIANYDGQALRLLILTSRLSEQTVNAFKTWLSNNNMTLYYILNTPTETQITDVTLISQLNAWYNAQSMNDITYITVDGNLPMQLKLKALKK